MKKTLTLLPMKSLCLFLLLACTLTPISLRAELAPSVYEGMQAKAPELLNIEILRVDVEPGVEPDQQKVQIVAMVTEVSRTATELKPNDLINISYTVTERPKGWAGPGAVPIPAAKDQTIAYLIKAENGEYAPAAGRMTYSKF